MNEFLAIVTVSVFVVSNDIRSGRVWASRTVTIHQVKMSLTARVRRESDRFEKLDSSLFVFALKQNDVAVHVFHGGLWSLDMRQYRKVFDNK